MTTRRQRQITQRNRKKKKMQRKRRREKAIRLVANRLLYGTPRPHYFAENCYETYRNHQMRLGKQWASYMNRTAP